MNINSASAIYFHITYSLLTFQGNFAPETNALLTDNADSGILQWSTDCCHHPDCTCCITTDICLSTFDIVQALSELQILDEDIDYGKNWPIPVLKWPFPYIYKHHEYPHKFDDFYCAHYPPYPSPPYPKYITPLTPNLPHPYPYAFEIDTTSTTTITAATVSPITTAQTPSSPTTITSPVTTSSKATTTKSSTVKTPSTSTTSSTTSISAATATSAKEHNLDIIHADCCKDPNYMEIDIRLSTVDKVQVEDLQRMGGNNRYDAGSLHVPVLKWPFPYRYEYHQYPHKFDGYCAHYPPYPSPPYPKYISPLTPNLPHPYPYPIEVDRTTTSPTTASPTTTASSTTTRASSTSAPTTTAKTTSTTFHTTKACTTTDSPSTTRASSTAAPTTTTKTISTISPTSKACTTTDSPTTTSTAPQTSTTASTKCMTTTTSTTSSTTTSTTMAATPPTIKTKSTSTSYSTTTSTAFPISTTSTHDSPTTTPSPTATTTTTDSSPINSTRVSVLFTVASLASATTPDLKALRNVSNFRKIFIPLTIKNSSWQANEVSAKNSARPSDDQYWAFPYRYYPHRARHDFDGYYCAHYPPYPSPPYAEGIIPNTFDLPPPYIYLDHPPHPFNGAHCKHYPYTVAVRIIDVETPIIEDSEWTFPYNYFPHKYPHAFNGTYCDHYEPYPSPPYPPNLLPSSENLPPPHNYESQPKDLFKESHCECYPSSSSITTTSANPIRTPPELQWPFPYRHFPHPFPHPFDGHYCEHYPPYPSPVYPPGLLPDSPNLPPPYIYLPHHSHKFNGAHCVHFPGNNRAAQRTVNCNKFCNILNS